MLDLGLFRRPSFALGISSGLLSSLVLFGVLFVVPFYFERSLGLGAGRAGLELMAMPFALGVVAPYAGRSADRIGARPLTVVGMVLVCAGLVAMGLRPGSGAPMVAELLVVGSASACSRLEQRLDHGGVPRESSGLASGVLNMTRGVGTALGLALTGLVFGAPAAAAGSRCGRPRLQRLRVLPGRSGPCGCAPRLAAPEWPGRIGSPPLEG